MIVVEDDFKELGEQLHFLLRCKYVKRSLLEGVARVHFENQT